MPTVKDGRPNDLVRACLQLLARARCIAWRNNTGAVKLEGRYVRFGVKGMPDILGALPGGKLIAVECKTGAGRLTREQAAVLDNLKAIGACALLVRDLRDLEAALRGEGALR